MVNKQTIIFAWALPVQKDISHIVLVIITARIQKNNIYIYLFKELLDIFFVCVRTMWDVIHFVVRNAIYDENDFEHFARTFKKSSSL